MKRNPVKIFDSNKRRLHIFHKYLMRENDVTPSNVTKMKTDVNKHIKMTSRYQGSDLLKNNSLQFSFASIGALCQHAC